jgi:hypothetical protein
VVDDSYNLEFTEDALVDLMARMKNSQFVMKRQQAKLKMDQDEAFHYQDVIMNYNNPEQY